MSSIPIEIEKYQIPQLKKKLFPQEQMSRKYHCCGVLGVWRGRTFGVFKMRMYK